MTDSPPLQFRAGQRWCYHAPPGHEHSRILIGAVVSFADREPIVCCAVLDAQRLLPSGETDAVLIPFLPMSAGALAASVAAPDGDAALPAEFGEAFTDWHDDARGLVAFTVAFAGRLDLMIARQMAEIVGQPMD